MLLHRLFRLVQSVVDAFKSPIGTRHLWALSCFGNDNYFAFMEFPRHDIDIPVVVSEQIDFLRFHVVSAFHTRFITSSSSSGRQTESLVRYPRLSHAFRCSFCTFCLSSTASISLPLISFPFRLLCRYYSTYGTYCQWVKIRKLVLQLN